LVLDESDVEWRRAHEALSALGRKRAELDAVEAKLLLRALRAEVHVHLGYATFGEYVERWLGYGYRTVKEKLRVAEALEILPKTKRALECGALSWSAIRELTRVALPETEREWLAAADGQTLRQVECLVAGRARGDLPTSDRKPELERRVLRFEVRAETWATFREALQALRRRTDETLDDDSALLAMAREVLGGPADCGRASYQVVVTTCESCGRGFQHSKGDLVELDPTVIEMVRCDAQRVEARAAVASPREPGGPGAHVDAIAQASQAADSIASSRQPAGPGAHVDAIAQASQAADFGARKPRPTSGKRTRAKQDTPPAVRRQVFLRDRGRCVVPGCRCTTYVDLHHLELRSDGGPNDAENLVVLCAAHHRALHAGRLVAQGTPSSGLRFRHADGTAYGRAPSPELSDAGAKAFTALRGLGFPEKIARSAVTHALSSLPHSATAEQLLRAALEAASARPANGATTARR